MEKSLTIALVCYRSLEAADFHKSLASALAQIGHPGPVRVYLDGIERPVDYPGVNWIQLTAEVCGHPAKIREAIVRDVETEYLAFWDADDIYSIDRTCRQLERMKAEQADLCFSDFAFLQGSRIASKSYFELIGYGRRSIDLFRENYIGLGTLTARTSFLKRLVPFPDIETLDWWIGIRARLMGVTVSCYPEVLGYYRIHEGSRSLLYETLSPEAFIQEKENRVALYSQLEAQGEIFQQLKAHYRDLDVQAHYPELKERYLAREYKNIWGGLLSDA